MAHINTPPPPRKRLTSLSAFLDANRKWLISQKTDAEGFLGQFWYRGVNKRFLNESPGVYRYLFTERADRLTTSGDTEEKRLRLEREMLSQFRIAGASHLNRENLAEIYFMAQHHGMPTRLLDWSTNPLAALFFACESKDDQDGMVYAMDARKVIPSDARKDAMHKLYPGVMTMRNPFVDQAIRQSFWHELPPGTEPHVLPIRPEFIPGRITQQSSCFTLHMHRANPVTNESLITFAVAGKKKPRILAELHRLNINAFTIYPSLDRLSQVLTERWETSKGRP